MDNDREKAMLRATQIVTILTTTLKGQDSQSHLLRTDVTNQTRPFRFSFTPKKSTTNNINIGGQRTNSRISFLVREKYLSCMVARQ